MPAPLNHNNDIYAIHTGEKIIFATAVAETDLSSRDNLDLLVINKILSLIAEAERTGTVCKAVPMPQSDETSGFMRSFNRMLVSFLAGKPPSEQ